MNIGDIVTLAKDAERIPAIVLNLYHDVHDEVVADLHALSVTHAAVPTVAQDAEGALRVLEGTPADNQPTTQTAPTMPAGPDAALSAEEQTFTALSPEDQAAFREWQANKPESGTQASAGGPST